MIKAEVYSTPTCGICHELIKLLGGIAEVEVIVHNMSDSNERTDALIAGMFEMSVPVLRLDDGCFINRRLLVNSSDDSLKAEQIKQLIVKMQDRKKKKTAKSPG